MYTILREKSTLFGYLRYRAAVCTQHLIDAGCYDPAREGPQVESIERTLQPFLETGKHTELPDPKLDWILRQDAIQAGTAFQALGSPDIATLWYRIGQYAYRGPAHWVEGDIMDLPEYDRAGPALAQEDAAICAALSGHIERAEQLFGWIVRNRGKTDEEIQLLEQERDYNSIWENLGYLIFALAWLGGNWDEIARLAEIGWRNIEKTRKAGYPKDYRTPQLLVNIGGFLSAYFLNPNDRTREKAKEALRLDKMHDRENHQRFLMLAYFFSLAARYPELDPYSPAAYQTRLWRPSFCQRDTPPDRQEIQSALSEILRQARFQKKNYFQVNSYDLHLQVGGFPSPNHRLRLCCEIMRERLKSGGKITGQASDPNEGWLEIVFPTL